MPELPEVETVRKGLELYLRNFLIERIEVLSERTIASDGGSRVFVKNMEGVVITHWQRKGKYLIAGLSKLNSIDRQKNQFSAWVIHLRMTGHFQWNPMTSSPCPHTRVRLWNKEGDEIRFVDVRNFGQMWWVPPNEVPSEVINGLKRLGPEPFSDEFNYKYLRKALLNRTRSIKASLLDQALIAGIGNIYADESLFDAGIAPNKQSKSLNIKELKKLSQSIVKVLSMSIGKGGTTFSDFRNLEGLNGNYGEEAWVYRRTNMPCKKCNSIIRRDKLSGRSTHWCPSCQK